MWRGSRLVSDQPVAIATAEMQILLWEVLPEGKHHRLFEYRSGTNALAANTTGTGIQQAEFNHLFNIPGALNKQAELFASE